MKIAITAGGKTPDSPFEKRFGRAPGFMVYDTDNGLYEYFDNTQNLNATQGAGIQSAQNVASYSASALISGHCGPKAFKVLTKAGIKIYNADASSIKEAVELYLAGKLTEASEADVEGHW